MAGETVGDEVAQFFGERVTSSEALAENDKGARNFSGVEIRRPPVEGEPMTAEKYLAARIPEAVVS